jgi:hypothetical protein
MPRFEDLTALAASRGFEMVSSVESDAAWGPLSPTIALRRL